MGASYYVVRNNNHEDRNEFSDTPSVINAIREQEQGEIYILGFADIAKIVYDLREGHVYLEPVQDQSGVTNVISEDAFQSFLQPIAEAVALLAKIDLLMRLTQLGDQSITDLIQKRHGDFNMNLTPRQVYQTLWELQHPTRLLNRNSQFESLIHSTQYKLADQLRERGIENISSLKVVDDMMNRISPERSHAAKHSPR